VVWIIEDFSEHILVRLQAEVVETRETRGAEAKSVTTAQKAVNLLPVLGSHVFIVLTSILNT